MPVQEPGKLEVFITVTLGDLAGGLFREYIDRLPLKGSERVLELGPSAGNSTRPLAQRLLQGGGCVTAVDISRVWTDVARKRLRKLPNVEILCGDITTLPLPYPTYDALFFSFILHELPAPERPGVLSCMVQKLAPGGLVFIREPLNFIGEAEIRQLAQGRGLVEISGRVVEVKTQGQTFEGVYQKTA